MVRNYMFIYNVMGSMLRCNFRFFYIRESSLSPLNTMKKLNRLITVDNVNGVLQLESGSEVMGFMFQYMYSC